MRNAFIVVLIASLIALYSGKYLNQAGYCEPLTVEFIATLVGNEIRSILDPRLKRQYKYLRFDLYTRSNPYDRQRLSTGDQAALIKSNFNPKWPVRFSMHGWIGNTSTCSNAAIKDAYLSKGDYNVILVDWSDWSLDINFIRVVKHVKNMGAQLTAFTRFINKVYHVPFAEMYLIGHSLGSHVAGVAGKLLKPHKYGVIFALDSSGPITRDLSVEYRLQATDALYVESIQTDIYGFGLPTSHFGHASFYPNWGIGQTHCPKESRMEPDFTCDHYSALYYFVESLKNPKAFGAIRCKNFKSITQFTCGCGKKGATCPAQVYMGGDPAVPKRGVYYLSTKPNGPFGFGAVCHMRSPLPPTVERLR